MEKLKPPRINTFLISHENSGIPSKMITTIYKIVQVLFGFNFGFFEFTTLQVRVICNLTTLLIFSFCIFIVIYLGQYSEWTATYWFAFYVSKYLAFVFLLFVTKNQLCNGLHTLGYIDTKLKVDSSTYNSDVKLLVPIFLSIFFRTVINAGYCYKTSCLSNLTVLIFYITIVFFEDFVSITNSFAFYSISNRLKTLNSKVMKADKIELNSYNHVYKMIADVADDMKKSFDPLFLVSLLHTIPEIMITAYRLVENVQNKMNAFTATSLESQLVYATLIVSLTFNIAPALIACTLATKANELLVILHDKWLQEPDPFKAKDIIKFADYVEARPLIYNVYKVIPLNTELLSLVVNFCVTYVIVLVQFTIKQ